MSLTSLIIGRLPSKTSWTTLPTFLSDFTMTVQNFQNFLQKFGNSWNFNMCALRALVSKENVCVLLWVSNLKVFWEIHNCRKLLISRLKPNWTKILFFSISVISVVLQVSLKAIKIDTFTCHLQKKKNATFSDSDTHHTNSQYISSTAPSGKHLHYIRFTLLADILQTLSRTLNTIYL